MKQIQEVENPTGTFSCEIGVTVCEWQELLSNKKITTPNYKYALMAFYNAPGHKATCSELSQKYYGNAKVAQKFNSWITHFGKAVVKHLNRFQLFDKEGNEHYWLVAMSKGSTTDQGLFEWTLRLEIVEAIKNLSWKMHFTWIPFYTEMADKLLLFKEDRKPLLDIVYGLGKETVGYIRNDKGGRISDIDPFTVMGIFNRNNTDDNRIQMCEYFKDKLGITADVPAKFDGIPTLNPMKSTFFWRENIDTDIQPLWNLYEAVLINDERKLPECFDIVCKQKGIKWNITMGFFWIRPYDYISLDSRNREYLSNIGIDIFNEELIDAIHYFHLNDIVKRKISSKDVKVEHIPELSFRAWLKNNELADELLKTETMIEKKKKYQSYIDLLEENYNLVLTGAPGTGKTFMAQAIADEMGAETMFVQFHPSYDYTDFVEGLRPVEKEDGQMGFERKDGAFKEFCRKAIKNMVDSEKSVENLTKENIWEEKLQQLIDDAIEGDIKFTLATGGNFTIIENRGHSVIIHNEQNEKTTQVIVNTDEVLELLVQEVPLNNVKDIRNHFNRKFGTQADSYAYAITKAVRAMKQKTVTADAAKVLRKPYVFIIDEINRGEASKIFGELFYAIDPGYRVKNNDKKEHLVQTQYQNLIPETDVFAKGFYVPENVYILATMNDIDRSVESMDFAMRRRFTWKEVTPEDTEYMLDNLTCANEAKAAMKRLNEAIAATDGLGAAYSIGPSYFLKLGENGGDFKKLWTMNIEPLLKEYLRGFRKTKEILEKFSKAYFNEKEATQELIDEN